MTSHKRIIILGPPGAGKGTQAELLSQKLGIARLSVGALIRRHYYERTELGIEAGTYMKQGLGIPADILMKMLKGWLVDNPHGFVIDNLVRTQDQLDAFATFQKQESIGLTHVFILDISEDEAKKRLVKRRAKTARPDESEDAVHARYETYRESIEAIEAYFKSLGIVTRVNGAQPVKAVYRELLTTLNVPYDDL